MLIYSEDEEGSDTEPASQDGEADERMEMQHDEGDGDGANGSASVGDDGSEGEGSTDGQATATSNGDVDEAMEDSTDIYNHEPAGREQSVQPEEFAAAAKGIRATMASRGVGEETAGAEGLHDALMVIALTAEEGAWTEPTARAECEAIGLEAVINVQLRHKIRAAGADREARRRLLTKYDAQNIRRMLESAAARWQLQKTGRTSVMSRPL